MSKPSPVRTPDGYKKNVATPPEMVSITDADSPYDLELGVYLTADSTAAPIVVNLPSAEAAGDRPITIVHPAGTLNDVDIQPVAGEEVQGVAAPSSLATDGVSTFIPVTNAGVFGWSLV